MFPHTMDGFRVVKSGVCTLGNGLNRIKASFMDDYEETPGTYTVCTWPNVIQKDV